jgi:hypothetical protein
MMNERLLTMSCQGAFCMNQQFAGFLLDIEHFLILDSPDNGRSMTGARANAHWLSSCLPKEGEVIGW